MNSCYPSHGILPLVNIAHYVSRVCTTYEAAIHITHAHPELEPGRCKSLQVRFLWLCSTGKRTLYKSAWCHLDHMLMMGYKCSGPVYLQGSNIGKEKMRLILVRFLHDGVLSLCLFLSSLQELFG